MCFIVTLKTATIAYILLEKGLMPFQVKAYKIQMVVRMFFN